MKFVLGKLCKFCFSCLPYGENKGLKFNHWQRIEKKIKFGEYAILLEKKYIDSTLTIFKVFVPNIGVCKIQSTWVESI